MADAKKTVVGKGEAAGSDLQRERKTPHERSSILLSTVPWTNGGVLSLLRVLAQLKTRYRCWGFLPQHSHTLVLD